MHVNTTHNGTTEIVVNITASKEDLEPIKQNILKKLSKNLKIAGFRAGKAPIQLVEKNLDSQVLQTEFLDEALTRLYSLAVANEKLRPITEPKVVIKKFVPYTILEFDVTTEVVNVTKLADYENFKLKSIDKKPSAEDVKKVIDDLATRMSERKEVTRPAKNSDEVIIDFKGTDTKGQPISGADGKDCPLLLGSNSFIPGFEDNLVGMKPNETKSFDITFPKNYQTKALAGKKAKFEVKVTKIHELTKPKIDDEFAKKMGMNDLAALKEDVKKQLQYEADNENIRLKQSEIIDQLIAGSKLDVPQSLIDKQALMELDEFKRNLAYRGQTYDEFLASENITDQEYIKQVINPRAENQIKASIILSEIATYQNLTVAENELDMQIQALKAQYKDPAMQTELDKPSARQDIASRILTQKVLDYILKGIS